MKEKIIQGGIVNGEKMLVCPTWEDEFQKAIHKTGGCFRISTVSYTHLTLPTNSRV